MIPLLVQFILITKLLLGICALRRINFMVNYRFAYLLLLLL